jgi:hypothetical protein
MSRLSPVKLIIIGLVLLVLGVILPLLMVLQLLESTFFLNFFAFTVSLVGMILGFVGTTQYIATHRKR